MCERLLPAVASVNPAKVANPKRITAEPPDPACVEGHRQLVIVYCVDGRGL
jgi:hypothetical protein